MIKYLWSVFFVVALGIVLGVAIGLAQEVEKQRELANTALDAVAYFRHRLEENEKMMNSCIRLYGEAQRVDTDCQLRLQRCVSVK